MPWALLALLIPGQTDPSKPHFVPRNPVDVRTAYHDAARKFADARTQFEAGELEPALEKLNAILADLSKVKVFERRLEIVIQDQDPKPFDFYPYQVRGRTHLKLASRKSGAEARGHLAKSVEDLETSETAHRCASSAPYLKEARAELWKSLQAALAVEAGDPRQAALGAEFRKFLERASEVAPMASWLLEEAARARAKLPLKPDPDDGAGRELAAGVERWCAMLEGAVQGLAGFEKSNLAGLRAEAARIANFQGIFRLKIAVNPYARVRLVREGTDLSPPGLTTPAVLPQALEIGEYEATFDHPGWPSRKWSFGRTRLGHGKTFILRGDMESGKFELDELPE